MRLVDILPKSSEKTDVEILTRLAENPDMTISKLAEALSVTTRAIEKQLAKLQEQGRLRRVGPARGGTGRCWIDPHYRA